MSTDQLKPCPFCGSAATLEDDRLLWVVRCTGCGTCVLGERAEEPEHDLPASYWEPFRQSAIDRWNRRAALAQPGALGPTDLPPVQETAPERIWLHLNGANEWLPFKDEEGVVWSPDQIDESDIPYVRADLARYGRPAITPIPVSERLPGAEDCLWRPWEETDAGFCWWLFPSEEWRFLPGPVWRGSWHSSAPLGSTHWLPHHALPLPSPSDHH